MSGEVSFFDRFRRGKRRSAPVSADGRGTAKAPGTVRLRSLALASLFSDLVAGGAYEFLDLGPAVGPNVEFLSRYGRGVQVGDLWATMNDPTASSAEGRVERALEPLASEGRYHVVLAWDLLNYLSPEELAIAAEMLARSLRPGGYLFAVVYYSAQMPAEPLRYTISDTQTLSYKAPQSRRPAPRYPQRTLLRAFGALQIEHAYLLKAGLQEYLFVKE